MLKIASNIFKLTSNLSAKNIAKSHLSTFCISYKFSQSNYERLNQSEFSKELGLENEFKKVIKTQKSNESSSFRTSATGLIIVMMIVGGYLFIKVIDKNELNLIKYKLRQWTNNFHINKSVKQQKEIQLLKQHQNNLQDIFNINYKNRSNIEIKFLRQIDAYVDKKVQQNQRNNLRSTTDKEDKTKTQISQDILQMIDQIREKFETTQEQKIAKTKTHFLSILQKLVYHHQSNVLKVNHSLISDNKKTIVDSFAKFLLKKGNLNQQILGIKYLQSSSTSQHTLHKVISKEQAREMIQRLSVNNSTFENSLKIKKHVQLGNQENKLTETQNKIISVKQELIYSIKQLKTANQIRRNKINFLNDLLGSLLTQNNRK